MADLLQEQYSSVFSNPNSADKSMPPNDDRTNKVLDNIEFTREDVVEAIDEISENSACGEDDIPAIVLKRCKVELSHPIHILWEESFKSGCISPNLKKQLITPVHKKESRAKAANYRPVSLTSHVMKIFERIIRKKLVKHLEENNLLCNCQHGFRRGRSCLTQLLIHIDQIHRNLLEGHAQT